MATEDELIGFVLDFFRVAGSGQTPNTEDVEFVRKYVAGKIDDLNARLGIYIADSAEIPAAQAPWIALTIAQIPSVAKFFGEAPDASVNAYAETMLGAQVTNDGPGTTWFTDF